MIEIFKTIKCQENKSLNIKEHCKYLLNRNLITISLKQLNFKEQFS